MKRKLSEYQCASNISESTRSKKPYLAIPKDYSDYVSGSSVINWFSNDCLVDWLKFKKELYKEDYEEENYLCEQGNKFEEAVIRWINNNICEVQKVAHPKDWSSRNVYQTFEMMQKGVPIIHSASIRNKHLKLYGTADLLVRNDYIQRLFTDVQIEKENANTVFSHPFYYYVVDIKWCTLHLLADGKSIENSGRFPGYKGQLSIYNNCLAEMQGFKPKYTFLLGRRVSYKSKGIETIVNSPFKLPGIFVTTNVDFNKSVDEAVKWVRDLHNYGHVMTVNPPSRKELYPNLGSKYYFQKKKELAKSIGDLSLLYKVKNSKKEQSFQKGIYNLYDYRLSGETLGFKNREEDLIDKIININRQNRILYDKGNLDIASITYDNEIFVDFEKFTDIFDDFKDISNHESFDMIFLIGVYYKNINGWDYKPFLIKEISKSEERKIIEEFYKFYVSLNKPKVWYWFAEDKFWNKTLSKYNLNLEIDWNDLRSIFIKNHIVIKNCYDYKLKSVIEAMNINGLIQTKNSSKCEDGVTAMLRAYEWYQDKKSDWMKDILLYNRYDVEGMKDIIDILRRD